MYSEDPLIFYTILFIIFFVSAFLRSALGFGDALLAMPLLVLLIDIYTATPLVAFAATTIAITLLWLDKYFIKVLDAFRFIIAAVIGIMIGIWMLNNVGEVYIQRFLGAILIFISIYDLWKPRLFTIKSLNWEYLFGLISGILGGAYNTKGPPIIIYGALKKWPVKEFRSKLQAYSFPVGITVLFGHGIGGLWNLDIIKMYFFVLPAILLGIWAGNKLHKSLNPQKYSKLFYFALMTLGVIMILNIK